MMNYDKYYLNASKVNINSLDKLINSINKNFMQKKEGIKALN